ncbi:MAG: GNAT family N-acetyltransferase [bacterium]
MSKLKIIHVDNKSKFNDFLDLYRETQTSKPNENIIKQLEIDFFKNKLFKLIVGYNNLEVVGFIIFIDSYSSTYAKKTCYIEEFYIKNELQNQGFGRQLFQYVIDYTKKNDYLRIEWSTQKNNQKAIDFYKKYNSDNEWLFYKFDINK